MDYSFTTPTWTMVGDMQSEIDMLHKENALKLKQILDLEQILYENRILDEVDGSPCWCAQPSSSDGMQNHSFECIEARSATEPFWKGVKK